MGVSARWRRGGCRRCSGRGRRSPKGRRGGKDLRGRDSRSRRWCSAGRPCRRAGSASASTGARLDAGGVEAGAWPSTLALGSRSVWADLLAWVTPAAPPGAGDDFGIGLLLALHAKLGRQRGGAQPWFDSKSAPGRLCISMPSTSASSSS